MRFEGEPRPPASPGDSLQVRAEDQVLPRRDGHLFKLVSEADLAGVSELGMQDGASQLAVLPVEVHHEAAARAEALDGAVRPGAGQGGQELDLAVVALQEHLGDAGGRAEVAVDLERRVGVEEVRQGVPRQGLDEHLVGVVAVEQAGPEVDLPGLAPARAAVAPEDQRLPRGPEELRACRGVISQPGIQAPQVRDVPVLVLRVVLVLEPLLELAVPADLVRGDPGAEVLELRGEARDPAQDRRPPRPCWRTGRG